MIENSSYGATNCAERVAIQRAVSEEGKTKIVEMVVLSDATPPWPPCGLCRQVIAEFASPDLQIHLVNIEGKKVILKFQQLFPRAFTRKSFK